MARQFFADPAAVGISDGLDYPDALAGGAHAAKAGAPLLLTDPSTLPPVVRAELQAKKGTIAAGFVYGGTRAVSDNVLQQVQAAIS